MNVLIVLGLLLFHFIGDFTRLNTTEMLEAKKTGSPLLPIIFHGVLHGMLALCFLAFFPLSFWQYGLTFLIVSGTHFVIDYAKGLVLSKNPQLGDAKHQYYWNVFAIDQYLHLAILCLLAAYIL